VLDFFMLVCVFKIKRLNLHKKKVNRNHNTQIPLTGMEKPGTKGSAFIKPITMRTKFSLSFSFRKQDPYNFWILKKNKKLKTEKASLMK
jgi:hypothetical protein